MDSNHRIEPCGLSPYRLGYAASPFNLTHGSRTNLRLMWLGHKLDTRGLQRSGMPHRNWHLNRIKPWRNP
jgi:hypothetical protein